MIEGGREGGIGRRKRRHAVQCSDVVVVAAVIEPTSISLSKCRRSLSLPMHIAPPLLRSIPSLVADGGKIPWQNSYPHRAATATAGATAGAAAGSSVALCSKYISCGASAVSLWSVRPSVRPTLFSDFFLPKWRFDVFLSAKTLKGPFCSFALARKLVPLPLPKLPSCSPLP